MHLHFTVFRRSMSQRPTLQCPVHELITKSTNAIISPVNLKEHATELRERERALQRHRNRLPLHIHAVSERSFLNLFDVVEGHGRVAAGAGGGEGLRGGSCRAT